MTITADRVSQLSEAPVPDHDELVSRAAALRDGLWLDAATCDRERRLTDEAIAGITDAGLTRLMTPKCFGGSQTDMRTFLDVTSELGRGCCSAAWVTGVLNAGNFVASLFPAAAQHELWRDDPDARTALVLGAPRAAVEHVEGGIRVTGEWPYASGSLHAEWVTVLIPSGTRSPGRDVHLVLIPVGDVVIKDTWHFSGMRGTGSNTIVADGVFVPHHRAIPFMPLLSGDADTLQDATHLYRNSLMGLFSVGLLGALIGGADTALQYVLEQGPNRPVAATTYANQTESPSFQLDLADAATTIDAAKLLAHRITDTVDTYAQTSQFPDLVIRARNRMDSNRVAHQCRETIDLLMTVYGSSAFAETNPLQRIWRDVNVGSRHAAFGMGIPQQLHGRALIGRDPREISFLV
jgi:alkylation response protein AidB-like acyl-CoA dehydrogenase